MCGGSGMVDDSPGVHWLWNLLRYHCCVVVWPFSLGGLRGATVDPACTGTKKSGVTAKEIKPQLTYLSRSEAEF